MIETVWCSMLKICDHDYFLSWGWISTWLKSLPEKADVRLVVGYLQDQPALAFFLGSAQRRKYKVLPVRTISLNTTGMRDLDMLYIEYNSVLCAPSLRFDMSALLKYLENRSWNEFILPGLSSDFVNQAGLADIKNINDAGVVMEEQATAYYVDLEKVRIANMDYFQLVSSNRRSQIRRSIKEYQKDGEIQVESAVSALQALQMLDALAELHQQEWEKRGEPGVFSNQYLFDFHKALISSRFDLGEIQLLKVFTPSAPIGYLYSFVYNNRILFYQSGFNYQPGNLYRPGLVSHYYGIMHNAQNGKLAYDFMAGEAGYKSSLATDSKPMYWMRLEKAPLYWLSLLKARMAHTKPDS